MTCKNSKKMQSELKGALVKAEKHEEYTLIISDTKPETTEQFCTPAAVEVVSCNHGVLDMRFHAVVLAQDRADTALGVLRATLLCLGLGDHSNAAVFGHLEGIAQTGDPASQHQEIIFANCRRPRNSLQNCRAGR